MWYLFLDESGDLGFDFEDKSPTKHFTVCILATSDRASFLRIGTAVRKTLARKLGKPRRQQIHELKGSNTSLAVKTFFWRLIKDCRFGIYAVTLNKRRVYENLARDKDRVYNFIARQVLDRIPFEAADSSIQIVIDRSKSRKERSHFDRYILQQLQGRLDPAIPIRIDHLISHATPHLQAVDLFTWGVFRKYEQQDSEWFEVYKEKVCYEGKYL